MKNSIIKRAAAALLSVVIGVSAFSMTAAAVDNGMSSIVKSNKVALHAVRGADGKLISVANGDADNVTIYQVATCDADGTWRWLGDFATNPPEIVIGKNGAQDITAKVVFNIVQKSDYVNGQDDFIDHNVMKTSGGNTVRKNNEELESIPNKQILITDLVNEDLLTTYASVLPTTPVIQLSQVLRDRAATTALSSLTQSEVKATGKTAAVDTATDEETALRTITLPNYKEDQESTSHNDESTVGYYLIVTNANGVEVQPTLEAYDVSVAQTDYIVPKSSVVPLTKTITSVTKRVENQTTHQYNTVTTGAVDTVDQHTSIASAESTVEYKITTRTPKYSPELFTGTDSTTLTSANFASNFSFDPSKFQDYTIIDDLSDGLELDQNSITVTIKGLGINKEDMVLIENSQAVKNGETQSSFYSVDYDLDTDNYGFVITFDKLWLFAGAPDYYYQDKEVEVTFKATLKSVYGGVVLGNSVGATDSNIKTYSVFNKTKSAQPVSFHTSVPGNPNTAQTLFANDYSTATGVGEKHDTVTTYVGQVDLLKFGDSQSMDNLKDNVEFTLTKKNNSNEYVAYTNEETDSSGKVSTDFEGKIHFGYLAPGDYKLHEEAAPSGFEAVSDIYFTVSADTNSDNKYDGYALAATTGQTLDAGVTLLINTKAGYEYNTEQCYYEWKATTQNGYHTIKVIDPSSAPVLLPGTGAVGTVVIVLTGGAACMLAVLGYFVLLKKRKS